MSKGWVVLGGSIAVIIGGAALAVHLGIVPPRARSISQNLQPPSTFGAPCDQQPQPPSLSQLIGRWIDDDTGEPFDVNLNTDGTVSAVGRHAWKGTFEQNTLRFERSPEPEEMGEAPAWARAQAKGRIKWELELSPKGDCGELTLEGLWYPGSFKWSEDLDAAAVGGTPAGTISEIGRGTPTKMRYTFVPPAIVGVIVLEDQTKNDALARPYYAYPFDAHGAIRAGLDNAGSALTIRTLYVYGENLPRTRDQKLTIAGTDPNLEYTVLAVKRDAEIIPGMRERYFDPGLRAAQLAHPGQEAAVARLDAIIVRVDLHAKSSAGPLPGTKNFAINSIRGSWHLRFGDDAVLVGFARAADGRVDAPSRLGQTDVDLTEQVFLPERIHLEIHTSVRFPIESIPLKVAVKDRVVSWKGSRTISARRVPGSDKVYRTDAIELVPAGSAPVNPVGAFFLPVNAGDRLYAAIADPWLFRQAPDAATATIYSGPGDLGHTYQYYLRRAAIVDKVADQLITAPNPWAALAGTKAASIRNVVLLAGSKRKPSTWKTQLIDDYLKAMSPLAYYAYHNDDLIEKVDVSVAEHAALLFFRDTFVDEMSQITESLDRLSTAQPDPAAMVGLRETLKAFAWSAESPWTRLKVKCPDGSSCAFSFALSDSFLEKSFGNDWPAARRWVVSGMADAVRQMADLARQARDKAKGVREDDIRGLVEAVGYSYEPLMTTTVPRLMKQDLNGKWVPDLSAVYSLRELHTLTDALAAQQELANTDTADLLKFALVPVCVMATPALASLGLSETAAGWSLFAADQVVTEIAPAYFQMPDVQFAQGASLAVGAEHLNELELKRSTLYYQTAMNIAAGSLMNGGMSVVPFADMAKSAAEMSRPALERVRLGGAAAFKKLSRGMQDGVLALMVRAKSVEQAGALDVAGAFEEQAVLAANRLAAEAGAAANAPPEAQVVVAAGNPTPQLSSPELPPVNAAVDDDEALFPREALDAVQGKTEGKGTGRGTPVTPDVPNVPRPPKRPEKWAGLPKRGDTIDLAATPTSKIRKFKVGDQLGAGIFCAAYQVDAVDGAPPTVARVLKLAVRDGDGVATGAEMVANSQRGYDLLKQRAKVRVLQTEFYSSGQQLSPKPGRTAYMLQEPLGTGRKKLEDILERLGSLPEPVQRKFATMWGQLRDARIVAEDLNTGNVYVELIGSATWSQVYSGATDAFELGILDFDRIILWDDFLAGTADRKMAAWFAYVQLVLGRSKTNGIHSMDRIWQLPLNRQLITEAEKATGQSLQEFMQFLGDRPGSFWGNDHEYFLEKMLEHNGYLKFNSASQQFEKGLIEPRFIEEKFPMLQDRSRTDPFLLEVQRRMTRTGRGTARAVPPTQRSDNRAVLIAFRTYRAHTARWKHAA